MRRLKEIHIPVVCSAGFGESSLCHESHESRSRARPNSPVRESVSELASIQKGVTAPCSREIQLGFPSYV
jgi:hypothetical protein